MPRDTPQTGSVRSDQPGDYHHYGDQHDREGVGFQPASHVAAYPAHVRRRKAVGESTHPAAERMPDRATPAQAEIERFVFSVGIHGTDRCDRGEF
jgi:hypothetical protein